MTLDFLLEHRIQVCCERLDQENLIDDMQNGADCAPVTDYAVRQPFGGCRYKHQRHLEAAPSALSRSWT